MIGWPRMTDQLELARTPACPHCRVLAEQNAQLAEEASGLLKAQRYLAGENSRLSSKSVDDDLRDPKKAPIIIVLENWAHLMGKRKDVLIGPGTKRWALTRQALSREEQMGEGMGLKRCLMAIEGLACKPYVTGHGRSASGRPSERFDDVKYALGDETRVDACLKYRAQAMDATEAEWFDAWKAVDATQQLYFQVWLGKWTRDQTMAERKAVQDAMVTDAGWGQVIDISTVRKQAA